MLLEQVLVDFPLVSAWGRLVQALFDSPLVWSMEQLELALLDSLQAFEFEAIGSTVILSAALSLSLEVEAYFV